MAENQSQNPFFFNPPLHHTRTKTNPFPPHHHSFPITSPSFINTNSAAYDSHHHHQQQQDRELSLSLSFAQQQQHQQPVPLGPFTGYASVLSSSRFLRPAQLILDELFGVNFDLPPAAAHFHGHSDEAIMGPAEFAAGSGDRMPMESRWKDSRLMLMLDEVYRRYKLYCQQMQTAVASFEAVPGLGNAAPFIYYAIRVVSSQFTSLKNALIHQIRCLSKPSSSSGCRNHSHDQHEHQQHPEALQYQNCNNNNTKPSTTFNLNFFLQSPPRLPQPPSPPVWRSQRGLPDHAVAMLKAWLFEHFLHPYPTDSEKQILAQQTGLSRTQVSNWFINARVRIWKPMVEEIQLLDSEHKAAATASSSSPFVQAPSPAGGSSSAAGSKRTRNSERRQRQSEMVEDQIRNAPAGLADCPSSDGVSLALALPNTANAPVNNPSPWPFNVSNTAAHPSIGHQFTGGRWY